MILTFSAISIMVMAIGSLFIGTFFGVLFVLLGKRRERVLDWSCAIIASGIVEFFGAIALYFYEGTWFLPK